MSINSFIGFLAAFGLFIGSIFLSTDNPYIFVDAPSLVMVLGGTLAATFLGQEARYVMLALKAALSIFAPQRIGRSIMNQEVGRVIKWGYIAQQNGIVGLDDELKKVKNDPFISFGLEMILSGHSGEDVRENMLRMVDTTFERNMVAANILKTMAGTAPAFGMIGTLVGLIIMLDNMGGDPKSLGPGLAVALNTTLYGVVIARMVFMPAANKMTQRNQISRFRMELMAEGMALLSDRKNPRLIQDRMNSFLDPAIQYDIDKQLANK
ncbi:motility protein A [Curvivirga aplysinae]|uniref:motility protein A n=1 Tax=Curvivirga aplysinae TaxID=2529852 RepID=UPI0012BC9375|nr:MotA/TolQ/ExbB proton channel family protein [Curvivirga aplysinae]MTI10875.1 flagellar motor protein MotA [Curvivirga aplysinae]